MKGTGYNIYVAAFTGLVVWGEFFSFLSNFTLPLCLQLILLAEGIHSGHHEDDSLVLSLLPQQGKHLPSLVRGKALIIWYADFLPYMHQPTF
jgi:hypothetical protein